MKIVKTASGKPTIKMSKKEWTSIGKKAGWLSDHKGPLLPLEKKNMERLNIIKEKEKEAAILWEKYRDKISFETFQTKFEERLRDEGLSDKQIHKIMNLISSNYVMQKLIIP